MHRSWEILRSTNFRNFLSTCTITVLSASYWLRTRQLRNCWKLCFEFNLLDNCVLREKKFARNSRENWNSFQHDGNNTARQMQAVGKPSNPSKARETARNIVKSPAIEQKFTPPATNSAALLHRYIPRRKYFISHDLTRVWNLVTAISLCSLRSSFTSKSLVSGRQTNARNLTERR